ncbi:prolipoprotein diacylglyceryl transferase [Salinivirga cyanobacteriivorans]|uniref:Phosphatidylglycerol--prolipoprotein diacylglyceryl transferase n=1 Tax=Salinivirga cyanobacteriivorans TaxID=1307839 RepID=A0A0S2I1L5_9BACT|nr:prolipoprotein diacylglyceryl transferase [Salinivirga cyanobacteriivorans]ALO16053.1 Prolipoprotein diacylglyceryl transferase [Salinivirga cyanobacteriivorans]
MILQAIHWNFDPEIFEIWGHGVRWYGLMFAFAFFFGYIIMKKYFTHDKLKEELLEKLSIYVFLGTLIGARLGHTLFYQPEYYLSRPHEILFVWEGGLASHGAAVGILLALWLYARKINVPYLWILDRVVIVVALGGFFIRMGNFFNSEIYGIETSLPWGVIFERKGETVPRHPTQIYEALSYLLIFIGLHFHFLKIRAKQLNGQIFGIFLVLLFSARFFIEFIKQDQVGFEATMKLNMGQWLSLPFIAIGIGLIFWVQKNKKELQEHSKS